MAKPIHDLLSLLGEEEKKVLTRGSPQYRTPMSARLSRRIFSDQDWLFERKLDGVRCLAVRQGPEVQLYSRAGKRFDANFPDIAEALKKLPEGSVVDGEIVAFAGHQTRFQLLHPYLYPQRYDRREGSPDERGKPAPCWYYLFDLLQLGPYDLRNLPLITRKKVLRGAVRFSRPLRFTNHRQGEGEHLYEIACQKGWEGVIAKRASSPYRSARSRDWLKFRCDRQQELVIGGYTAPQGSRREFGALLMGFFEGTRLRYAGKVKSGFDYPTQSKLKQAMDPYRQQVSPFSDPVNEKDCRWLAPELVCEVSFSDWTRTGKLLYPRYLRFRDACPAYPVIHKRAIRESAGVAA